MNDWSKLVEAAGLAVEHDSETIAEMSLRIAELRAENARLREYVQHKPECWKNQSIRDLGVGGK